MKKMQKLDKGLMRKNNMQMIFDVIYKAKSISRPQIARETDMSLMAVGQITDALIEMGLIVESVNTSETQLGRPPKLLEVAEDNLYCIGISLDRDGVYVGMVSPYGKILHSCHTVYAPGNQEPHTALKTVAETVNRLIAETGFEKALDIGIVVPGLVDWEQGVVLFSSQLKWTDVAIAEELRKMLGVERVFADNDVKARAQSENQFGTSYGYGNSVLLNLGSGIGAAVVLNHQIYRGKGNMAAEIGHIVINPHGRMCECGRIGCLQSNLTDWAILQEARSYRPGITIGGLFDAYEKGETWARTLLTQVIGHVSIAINLLANTYAPDVIVLCGSLIDQNPAFRLMIEEHYKNQHQDMFSSDFDLKFSTFGPDGNTIGAASIAFARKIESTIMKDMV